MKTTTTPIVKLFSCLVLVDVKRERNRMNKKRVSTMCKNNFHGKQIPHPMMEKNFFALLWSIRVRTMMMIDVWMFKKVKISLCFWSIWLWKLLFCRDCCCSNSRQCFLDWKEKRKINKWPTETKTAQAVHMMMICRH